MSLSRVIKSGKHPGRSIDSFYFSNFQGKPGQNTNATAQGFTPLTFGGEVRYEQSESDEPVADEALFEPVNVAEGMIALSEEELASKIEEAYNKGIEDERRQADDDLAGICSALTEAISIVSRLRERIVKESEDELLKLSFVLAKKIIRQEIKQDRQIMAQVVSEALREFPEQHDIIICLHPEDYQVISSNRELFLAGVGNDRQITLKPDEAMSVGGCVVESSTGVIDARIEAQLDEIYRSLVEERNILFEQPESGLPISRIDKELTDEVD
jgi:flagellar assembly protein FliH